VVGNRYLRGIAASTGISNLFSSIAFATFILYAVRQLGLSAVAIGIVFGIGNLGALAGALTGDRWVTRFGLGRTIVGSMFLNAPGILLVALAPRSFPFPFLIVSGLLIGYSEVIYNINQVSFRQAITPSAMQGRMNATMRFIVWGTMPIGQVLGGIIATTVSLSAAIWVGAIGSFLAVIPLLITPVHSLTVMPDPVDDGPGVAPTASNDEMPQDLPPDAPSLMQR